MISYATIEYTEAENDDGYDVECVFATCEQSGVKVGPVWGHHERSVRRALATLGEKCDCGGFHRVRKPKPKKRGEGQKRNQGLVPRRTI